MATRNFLLGTAKGKLGDIVFARRNGEQFSRAYVKNVKNPQTDGQLSQRARMTTAMFMYKLAPLVFDKTFPKKVGQSGYNAFMSKNLSARTPVTEKMSEAEWNGEIAVYPAAVSRGPLKKIVFSAGMEDNLPAYTVTTDAETVDMVNVFFMLEEGGLIQKLNIVLKKNYPEWTKGAQEVSNSLLWNFIASELLGDEKNHIGVLFAGSSRGGVSDRFNKVDYREIFAIDGDTSTTQMTRVEGGSIDNEILFSLASGDGSDAMLIIQDRAVSFLFRKSFGANSTALGIGVININRENGVKVSDCDLVLGESTLQDYNYFLTDGEYISDVINSYRKVKNLDEQILDVK